LSPPPPPPLLLLLIRSPHRSLRGPNRFTCLKGLLSGKHVWKSSTFLVAKNKKQSSSLKFCNNGHSRRMFSFGLHFSFRWIMNNISRRRTYLSIISAVWQNLWSVIKAEVLEFWSFLNYLSRKLHINRILQVKGHQSFGRW
jgi:hypothetical protein